MFVDPSRLYEEEAQGRRGSFPFVLCYVYIIQHHRSYPALNLMMPLKMLLWILIRNLGKAMC